MMSLFIRGKLNSFQESLIRRTTPTTKSNKITGVKKGPSKETQEEIIMRSNMPKNIQ
jgi:hypothetical protein